MSSPIRCRGPWKIHKRTSEPDRWLEELGYFRKHTARDASCLFRAVSENVYNTQRYYHKVRLDCVNFMASNRHLFEGSLNCPFENYIKEMSNPSEGGGLIEITAMSHLYRRDFIIFEANKGPQTKITNGYGNTIQLFYSSETKHFDVVYTKEFINNSSFCQSLVYEILYDGVYQLKDLSYAIDKMLHDKVPTSRIEYFMSENMERRKKQKERAKIFIENSSDDKDKNNNALALKCKHHTEDTERASLLKESLSIFVFNRSLIQLENVCMNCLNVNSAKDLLDNGITPFPYKVAKALDPDIYRNIEFDVWSEMRREQRYGARYSDGTTLQVGVKCLCKLDNDQTIPYHCHIQDMNEGGPCLVFIEELGEKRVVHYDQLKPLPVNEARPWAPPYRYSRTHSQILTLSQMLQQIGNITKKQSLNKIRKAKSNDEKSPEKHIKTKMSWSEMNPEDKPDLSQYQNMDFFESLPIEVQALPLMVDCRSAAGGPPHEMPHAAPNGAPPPPQDNHHPHQVNQSGAGGSGDMGSHGITSPGAGRASTPAANTYTPHHCGGVGGGNMNMGGGNMGGGNMGYGVGVGWVKAGGGVMWAPPAPPPPLHVNPHVYKSVQANGADLPMNDIPTLRYYYNLGVECMWAAYGPPPPPPPRHYSPRDIAQEMAGMSLHERGGGGGGGGGGAGAGDHKHKGGAGDKPPPPKPNSQRPLLGPRFKRGNNQDGNNQNNQNKGHNNNMNNKGPNNRRNMNDSRNNGAGGGYGGEGGAGGGGVGGGVGGEGGAGEAALVPLGYMPYPPPPAMYPLQYYPVDPDPAMMGMMGGVSYVGYDEGVEYGVGVGVGGVPYYPPHLGHVYPPLVHHAPLHHAEHK